jgi:hypothetical protein
LEQISESVTDSLKQQFFFRKIFIGSVNNTLSDFGCNEAKMKEGFLQIKH